MARTRLFSWMGRMVRQALSEQAGNNETSDEKGLSDHAISRRDFLKTVAGGTFGLMTVLRPSAPALSSPLPRVPHSQQPVVIVGGGLAGLVTAYRLSQHGVPCEIYEAGSRMGGRVHTLYHFNREEMFVELGAELVDTVHTELIALCEELHVPLERFPESESGLEPALYFSEGRVHTVQMVLEAFAPMAKALARDIQRCFPDGNIQIPTYREPYNAHLLDRQSLADWLHQLHGTPSWLIRLIKAAYTGEYGLDPEEQSALNLLLLIGTDTDEGFRMFGESDEAMRVEGGNSQLPNALEGAIRQKGVPIYLEHRLSHIETDSSGELRLAFQTTEDQGSGRKIYLNAARAVLALPFSVLRGIEGVRALPLSPVKQKAITTWGYGTNSKQMIGFRSRFWREAVGDAPAASGELFSDLPSQCYWETSRLQSGASGVLTNFLGGRAGRMATSRQWQASLKDLDRLYGGRAHQEFDERLAFANWSENKLSGGSYSCPRPGQYTTIMGAAGEPELGGRLLFAGEHCSVAWAGFMNGAVQTGEDAAKQIIQAQQAMALIPVRVFN